VSARPLESVLTLSFVVFSAFIAADIVNTIARGALETVPSLTSSRPLKRAVAAASVAHATAATAASPPVPTAAPPVKLIGTTTGAYPSAVIVGPSSNHQTLHRLKDDVGGGWLIAEIHANRVVLRNGGRTQIVEVAFNEAEPSKSPGAPAVPASRSGIKLDSRDVDAALSDLNRVMTQARVVPYMVGNKIAGYTIFEIAPGSVYTKLGLLNNDVVERVNGVEIQSPEALYQLFQQIRTQRMLALDLSRNGRKETINIEIR
jgi:type II secretion system protein C